jgi:phosphoesterase RecJ-like protein
MSSTKTNTTEADLAAVAEALRSHERFTVTTHENPDGDALGSLLAMTLALREMGKDATMYLFGEVPIPNEYEFMDFAGIVRGSNPDSSDQVVVALDCANEDGPVGLSTRTSPCIGRKP